jgi:D-lactate dehydrogenase
MRLAMFSTKPYDRRSFQAHNDAFGHDIQFLEPRLNAASAPLAAGFPAVCLFVNDVGDAATLEALARGGTRIVALRCAGFNNVDLGAAGRLGLKVVRVPAYSPHAVAEFAAGLILTLDRQIHRAYVRTRENNFALDGLLGFDLHGKTVGVVGTGRIGTLVARSLRLGFGCEVLAHDQVEHEELKAVGCHYVPARELAASSDIITLHCPLTPQTRHLVNAATLAVAKPGFMLVNTSRGALIDVDAVIWGAEDRPHRLLGHRRLRAGSRPVLRGPLQRDHPRRRLPAPAHLSQRPRHRPPSVLHPRGHGRHRRDHARKPHGLRAWRAAGERGRAGEAHRQERLS